MSIKTNQIGEETDKAMISLLNSETVDFNIMPLALSKIIKENAKSLSFDEAKFIKKMYDGVQKTRLSTEQQIAHAEEVGSSHIVLDHFYESYFKIEDQLKKCLGLFAEVNEVGRWLVSLKGIGPIFAGNLITTIDIEKAPHPGNIMSFAGMTPGAKRVKGETLKYSLPFKTVLFLIGDSFMKLQNRDSYYGRLYKIRKMYEINLNEKGCYKEQAEANLSRLKNKNTITYKQNSQGKLSAQHLDRRVKRWVLKIFISHVHYVMYRLFYGAEPAKPFAICNLNHSDILIPPNLSMFGWEKFYEFPIKADEHSEQSLCDHDYLDKFFKNNGFRDALNYVDQYDEDLESEINGK